jgi:exosome complex exonuclease RRP6
MVLYYKSKRSFDNRQLYAMKEIFLWRDKLARQEDESTGYVLPQHMLLQIAESLPREMQGILACCNPIPPLVRQHLQLIHYIILKAREQPLIKVS